MKLSAEQRKAFFAAMLDAFRRKAELARLASFELDENLEEIVGGNSLSDVTLELITWAEQNDRVHELVLGARAQNSGNKRLKAFADQLTFVPAKLARPELERLIDDTQSYLDAVQWIEKMRAACAAICRVDIQGAAAGTGFLVAEDALLTNYHVLAPVLEGNTTAGSVRFRFDFYRFADGQFNSGVEYGLAESDWRIDASPTSPADWEVEPAVPASPEHLDYALVRLAAKVGALPVGATPAPDAPPRGWLQIPSAEPLLEPKGALHVIQHPAGQHLKLALGAGAILGVNAEKTRVRYSTNTDRGSSGSPCFDKDWNLIALHHAGDPNYESLHKPTYNQGIPLWAVRVLLASRGSQQIEGILR